MSDDDKTATATERITTTTETVIETGDPGDTNDAHEETASPDPDGAYSAEAADEPDADSQPEISTGA